jgi:hypothetical protein
MSEARTVCVPAATPAMVNRPASFVSAPSCVPMTATCALASGRFDAESTTRPVMTPATTSAFVESVAGGRGGVGRSAGTSAMRPLLETQTSTSLSPRSWPSACSTDPLSTSTETMRSAGMNARLYVREIPVRAISSSSARATVTFERRSVTGCRSTSGALSGCVGVEVSRTTYAARGTAKSCACNGAPLPSSAMTLKQTLDTLARTARARRARRGVDVGGVVRGETLRDWGQ